MLDKSPKHEWFFRGSYHENQITPKQTILATDSQWIFKEQSTTKFPKPDNIKHNPKNHASIYEFAHRAVWFFT